MEIYVDHAATTKMSRRSIEAMVKAMEEIYGNPSSMHTTGQIAAKALSDSRTSMAQHLGCDARDLYFTSGGSESDNQAILTAAAAGRKKGKKHIVSTKFEHHAVLHALEKLEKDDFEITLVDVNDHGIVLPADIEGAIRPDTCLVSVIYANNEIGTIQPIAEIGKVCKEKGVLFHTDAVQAAGHLPIDVIAQDIDLLSLSAHKFGGPKGVGALYSRRGVRPATLIEGGAQERGVRAGTENIPAIVAMAAAFDESCSNMEAHAAHSLALRERLIEGLSLIPHSALNGDRNNRLPGNVNFCFEGIEGEGMLLLLDQKGIRASSGSACTSGSLEPSHVLIAIGRSHEVAHGSLRITLNQTNTQQQVDDIIQATAETVSYLRGLSPVWRDLEEGRMSYVL